MNKQEFEQMLITDMFDGFPYDVTKYIGAKPTREENLEEILGEMIHTFAVFQHDPVRMRDAMKRYLLTVVNDIVEDQKFEEYELTDDDYRDFAADQKYIRSKEGI